MKPDYPKTEHRCPLLTCPKRGKMTCALCDDCGPPEEAVAAGTRECPCCGRPPPDHAGSVKAN